jgi:hypothetical protein
MWNREPRYLRLSGQALLDYAHSRGVWLTDANFSPEHNRDLVEKGCAAKLGDAEIRSRNQGTPDRDLLSTGDMGSDCRCSRSAVGNYSGLDPCYLEMTDAHGAILLRASVASDKSRRGVSAELTDPPVRTQGTERSFAALRDFFILHAGW